EAKHVSLDGAYDSNNIYQKISDEFKDANIVIPPDKNAVISDSSHQMRTEHLKMIKKHGRMYWQRYNQYGKRNYSELCIQRYKRILGNKIHGREMDCHKQESKIGCGALNKRTSLGMPQSYRCV
ncbi:MAG: transposase, partial [Francisellaceae bacterium]